MSDFDREAEREKLREKYEQEQKEREATEKMSELLLQGATMTNAHCSDCGDPIFRYDGQEFCASCEKAVDRDTGTESGDEESADTAEETENIEVTSPDDEARVAFGGENVQDSQDADQPAPAQPGDASPDAEAGRQPQQSQHPQQSPPTQRQSSTQTETQPQEQTQPQQSQTVPSVEPNSGGDVSAARESLVRTLTQFSQRAEATDDPQRAQAYLAAAREAAETLSVLRS